MLFRHRISKGTSIELNNLRQYIDTLEDALEKQYEELKRQAIKIIKKGSSKTKEEQEKLNRFYGEGSEELLQIFPAILRSSLFITCYSLFESDLEQLCEYLCTENSYSVKLREFCEGRGIHRSRKYLKKVVCIDFPDRTSPWQDIVNYNHIRNFVVHKDGKLDDSKRAKKVKAFIETRRPVYQSVFTGEAPSIYLNDINCIRFREKACSEFLDTLEAFSDTLHGNL